MKKNKMMRVASALLVAVLMTTSVISGTFAKYVTTDSATDSARVAKWGVTIIANGATFAETYAQDDTTTTLAATNTVETGTSGEKIVAPGTSGNMLAMTLSGSPEVAVNVTYEATLTLTGWALADNTEYCPIVFTVNNDTYSLIDMGGKNVYEDIDDLKTAVETAIENYSANYAANQDLSVENTVATPDVSWEWAFETGDDATKATNNSNDTYLGNQASIDNAPTITLTVKTTVTQID